MSDGHGQFIKPKTSRRKSGVLLHEQNSRLPVECLENKIDKRAFVERESSSEHHIFACRDGRWAGNAEYTHLDNNIRTFLRWVNAVTRPRTTRSVNDTSAASFSSLRDGNLHQVNSAQQHVLPRRCYRVGVHRLVRFLGDVYVS